MAPAFERTPPASGPLVQGFAGKGFRVDGIVYEAVLLTPERAIAWEPPPRAELRIDHFEPLLALVPQIEFLLFGAGAEFGRLPSPLRTELLDRGIGFEPMDSRAAARAWGLLRGEGRWIAAALMPL
jgi:uncharacterized protein